MRNIQRKKSSIDASGAAGEVHAATARPLRLLIKSSPRIISYSAGSCARFLQGIRQLLLQVEDLQSCVRQLMMKLREFFA
jgi:hypothetical protein